MPWYWAQYNFRMLNKLMKCIIPCQWMMKQGFWISKIFGHPTSGSRGKNTFKCYFFKISKHTNTYGQIDLQKALARRADALKTLHQKYTSLDILTRGTNVMYGTGLANKVRICHEKPSVIPRGPLGGPNV